MSYPQIIDYNEAVQDPRSAFIDPELRAGRISETPLGLPLALSGGFALTYTLTSGQKKYAVRCFHHAVPEVESRYAAISARLRGLATPHFVDFDFQANGIRVRGKPYPIVKMHWAEGDTLGLYLDRNASNAPVVASLRRSFGELAAYLERNGIAHGDIQNENVIVANGVLRLIDYDGVFVPGMQEGRGSEVGHKHFQHPGREPKHFGPRMDRFSSIVVDVSLEALMADPGLHRRFREGGQAIIFKANDFANPAASEVFRTLEGIPAVRDSARRLAALCRAPISAVPTLAEFVAGLSIPVAPPTAGTAKPELRPAYIGAFDVIDAKNFAAVLSRVGDKVELIGKIVSVKQGVGKRGRGRGQPYVFINFGPWNKESVKITIWSEGLGNMTTPPTEAWVGRWISATGLIEPPYEGSHYGRPYTSVGITVSSDNEIVALNEQEAKFRLRKGPPEKKVSGTTKPPKIPRPTPSGGGNVGTRNQQILKGIQPSPRNGRQTAAVPGAAPPRPSAPAPNPAPSTPTVSVPPTVPLPAPTPSLAPRTSPRTNGRTRNQEILAGLNVATGSSAPRPTHTAGTPRPSSVPGRDPERGAKFPAWIWVAAALLVLALLLFANP